MDFDGPNNFQDFLEIVEWISVRELQEIVLFEKVFVSMSLNFLKNRCYNSYVWKNNKLKYELERLKISYFLYPAQAVEKCIGIQTI